MGVIVVRIEINTALKSQNPSAHATFASQPSRLSPSAGRSYRMCNSMRRLSWRWGSVSLAASAWVAP